MAPKIGQEVIGMRPGEKIHEIMCPVDDARLTIEFSDHFVISPAITFFDGDRDYLLNALKEQGQFVNTDFEYSSGSNLNALLKPL